VLEVLIFCTEAALFAGTLTNLSGTKACNAHEDCRKNGEGEQAFHLA
jgi:hypothetical protein